MKLSIVVPVYNEEKYIVECVTSIITQSKQDIEVILIDDGSTDNSGRICDDFSSKDERVRIIHQSNKGMIHARMRGLEECSSQYVTFVDADDFVDGESFAYADSYMDKGIDAICFHYKSLKDGYIESKYIGMEAGYYNRNQIQERILPTLIWDECKNDLGVNPSLWNKIIKKEILESCYRTLKDHYFDYCEDRAVVYPVLMQIDDLQVCPQEYYCHRQREKKELPNYMLTDAFFDNCYDYYRYMRQWVKDDLKLKKQLELSYIGLVSERKRIYRNYYEQIKYVFPFNKVNAGERIVVFGAGAVGRSYVGQVKAISYCDIVLWIDSNYSDFHDIKVEPVDKILSIDYDKIVLANVGKNTKNDMLQGLVRLGVSKDKIVY